MEGGPRVQVLEWWQEGARWTLCTGPPALHPDSTASQKGPPRRTPDGPLVSHAGAALLRQVHHKEHAGGQQLQRRQRQQLHLVALLVGASQQPRRVGHLASKPQGDSATEPGRNRVESLPTRLCQPGRRVASVPFGAAVTGRRMWRCTGRDRAAAPLATRLGRAQCAAHGGEGVPAPHAMAGPATTRRRPARHRARRPGAEGPPRAHLVLAAVEEKVPHLDGARGEGVVAHLGRAGRQHLQQQAAHDGTYARGPCHTHTPLARACPERMLLSALAQESFGSGLVEQTNQPHTPLRVACGAYSHMNLSSAAGPP